MPPTAVLPVILALPVTASVPMLAVPAVVTLPATRFPVIFAVFASISSTVRLPISTLPTKIFAADKFPVNVRLLPTAFPILGVTKFAPGLTTTLPCGVISVVSLSTLTEKTSPVSVSPAPAR